MEEIGPGDHLLRHAVDGADRDDLGERQGLVGELWLVLAEQVQAAARQLREARHPLVRRAEDVQLDRVQRAQVARRARSVLHLSLIHI